MPKKRSLLVRLIKWACVLGLIACLALVLVVGGLYYKISPELPSTEALRDVQLQIPLRIYTADGDLIAEYGEKRREPVDIAAVPQTLKNAIIAAEDKRFYVHPGVDWQGLLRAFVHLVKTGSKGPGGSTITMQVARNFFLTNEKTYSRKINEIFLSLRIETELSKDEILELYINKIYLGNRSYGFAAASRVYYGKSISGLNLQEAAMLAGLPKAPSRYNPIVNPSRALARRNYVLNRMAALDMIDQAEYDAARATGVTASLHFSKPEAEANYIGEMARARIKQLYGDSWSTAGHNVYTSIRSDAQIAANKALRSALFAYEKRHGFTGPLTNFDAQTFDDPEALRTALADFSTHGELLPAVVFDVTDEAASIRLADAREFELGFADVEWARERIDIETLGDELTTVSEVLNIGDVIHVVEVDDDKIEFVQEPTIEGAFVAMKPDTGEITALVGGFDFNRSKFNRVTQARRQPGSTFKPFIYSAALEKGDTAATIYNDAPVVFHDDALEGEWRPSNYSGRFFGPTRLREALVKSRNLVSIRVLREIGIPYAREYATRFGFAENNLPPDLSLALGSASTTPLEIASAFAVFANDGYRITPHFITAIEDPRGRMIYEAPQIRLCDDCDPAQQSVLTGEILSASNKATEPQDGDALETVGATEIDDAPRVIDERNAFIMQSMMREVIERGTARKAKEVLERSDLGGKTGTTNNQLDAWFTGFNKEVVAAAWVGSDGLTPLGRGEAGGIVALPMWVSFIDDTMDGVPEVLPEEPEGIVMVNIDPETGEPSDATEGVITEIFRVENAPGEGIVVTAGGTTSVSTDTTQVQKTEPSAAQKKREKRNKKKKVEQLF